MTHWQDCTDGGGPGMNDWVPPRVSDAVAERPDPLAVRSLRVGELLIVEAEGALDGRTVGQLTSALHGIRGAAMVILDVSGLTILDTVAAEAIVAARRRLQSDGKGMALLCPPGEVRRVLDLLRVSDAVPAFADPDAAIDAAAELR
jgi:anti-sigma B factor antagonist